MGASKDIYIYTDIHPVLPVATIVSNQAKPSMVKPRAVRQVYPNACFRKKVASGYHRFFGLGLLLNLLREWVVTIKTWH